MPFFINRNFENQLYEYLSSIQSWVNARPVNLGGMSGPGGGSGGPWGFIGQLPQTKVTYDTTEAATYALPASGWSLLTNLNRIRSRITVLENLDATDVPITDTQNYYSGTNVETALGEAILYVARLTTSGRDDLTPENGMLIYNTTAEKFQGFENGSWTNLI
jgi:hypothetical protein